ncbi:MAG: Bcr/CflA family efflux MFS transporter [Gammaproteobacteria bacterium]|nr:MAG: Bcr/CflA family efflux MFS transporter [Gammaproteobacteria bacterium]UTW43704.1 multidrug effflux MFS transporter [bacterium SCSIO 12844]
MSSVDKSQHRAIIFVVIALIILMVGATDLHIPSLPAIQKSLFASVGEVQLTVTLYLIGYAVSPLVYGPLSDAYGRRGILIFGLVIAFFGSLLCTFAPSIEMLLAGRVLQGLGLGAGSAMMRAIFRDAFTGKTLAKVGSYMGTASSLSMGLAPTLGGFVQEYAGWRFNFAIIVIAVVIGLYCVLRYLPETHHNRNIEAKKPLKWFKSYFELIRSKAFISCVCMAGFAFSGLIVYATAAPFLLQTNYGLSAAQFGLLSLFIAAAQAVGFNLNGRLLKVVSINQAMLIGVIMMLISGLMLILFYIIGGLSVFSIIVMIVIYVIGTGFIYANAYAQAFSPFGHIIGFAAAMYGMLQTTLGGLSSFIVAVIPHYNALIIGIMFSALAVVSLITLAMVVKYVEHE